MLETIAIRTVGGKILDFFRRIPWFVWVAIAVLALWWLDRSAQYREGRADVVAELKEAEARAKERAAEARAQADEKAEIREAEETAKQEALTEVIENAEKNSSNALDDLLASGLW